MADALCPGVGGREGVPTAPDPTPGTRPPVSEEGPRPPGPETEVERLIGRVTASGRTIKSQQRGDPELTETQKIEILSELLHRNPAEFLRRYGSLLSGPDLTYFNAMSTAGQYEVQFRLQELRRGLDPQVRQRKIRNRRFECLKEMIENTTYFSEEEMRSRNPLLYEQYIGQYLTEEERDALDMDKADMSLSGHILRNMELNRMRKHLKLQRQKETEQLEESDTSSEDEGEEGDEEVVMRSGLRLSTDPAVAAEEKAMLRREFLRAMQLSFLNGEDKEFDYSKVDQNDRYDSLELRGRDEEDSYFDAEEPAWCGAGVEADISGVTETEVAMDTGDGSASEEYDYMSDKYIQGPMAS